MSRISRTFRITFETLALLNALSKIKRNSMTSIFEESIIFYFSTLTKKEQKYVKELVDQQLGSVEFTKILEVFS